MIVKTKSVENKSAAPLRSTKTEQDFKNIPYDSDKHKNVAFLYIKPHANTEHVQSLVRDILAECNVDILTQGRISYEEIKSSHAIDNQYFSIGKYN